MKKVLTLLVILAVLIGFFIFHEQGVEKRQNTANEGAPMREHVLPDLNTKDKEIRAIHVREGDKQVHLPLVNGVWTVAERSGYPASFDKIERAVRYLADMTVKGKTVIKPSVLGDVKLAVPGEGQASESGLFVELLDEKGGKVAAIVAGDTINSSGGASSSSGNMFSGAGNLRYVRVLSVDDKDTVWSVDDSFYELTTEPKDWLDKSFPTVGKVKTAEITAPDAADSWKVERKDEDSTFAFVGAAAGEELDTAKADGLTTLLSSASINDVVPKDKVNEVLMKDAVKAKITTFDGFTYEFTALDKKKDSEAYLTVKVSAEIPKERTAPADEKPEDKKKKDEEFAAEKKSKEDKLAKEKGYEGWVFVVPTYNMNVLLKKKSEVLRDKTAPAPPAGEGAPAAPGASSILPTPYVPGVPVMPPGLKPPTMTPPNTPIAPTTTPPPAKEASPVPGAKPTEATTPPVEAKPPTPPAPVAKPPTEAKQPPPPPAPKPSAESKGPAADAPKAPATPPPADAKPPVAPAPAPPPAPAAPPADAKPPGTEPKGTEQPKKSE